MTPYYADEFVTLYLGDCRTILADLPPADLLLTDPPYGIRAGSAFVRRNTTTIEDWATVGQNVYIPDWHHLVQATDAWAVEFGLQAGDGFRVFAEHIAAGWTPANVYTLVKSAPPPTPRPGFCSATELALVSRIGRPKWHGGGYVMNRWIGMTPNQANNGSGHPTEKPLAPISALVGALSRSLVLDPFAGSGTTLVAAKCLGRQSIGIEIDEQYCEMAARRLDQGVLVFGDGP